MIVIKSSIFLYSHYVCSKTIMSGVRCSLIINEEPHICLIESLDEKDIPLNVLTTVKITVISGEINLIAFLEGAKFTLFRGKEVGWGNVDYIEEAYLERENLEVIKDKKKLRAVIDYAEQLSCALIYEDVYDLIGEEE